MSIEAPLDKEFDEAVIEAFTFKMGTALTSKIPSNRRGIESSASNIKNKLCQGRIRRTCLISSLRPISALGSRILHICDPWHRALHIIT